MKRQYVEQLEAGMTADDVFFLREFSEHVTKSSQPYFALKLSDRSGLIEGRVWRQVEEHRGALAPDSFVRVRGTVESFRNRLQLNVSSVCRVDDAEVDQADFLPGSYRDREELTGYIRYFLTEIYDADYLGLLESFFGDAVFMERFCQAPGDMRSHHAYLGGLLEHTVSVATLCQHVTVQHPRLSSDLLLTAALLHDVGKVEEFCYSGRFRLSREGELLGHVLLSQRLIEERIRAMEEFPREKELELLHAIISHHGELEWGAPKRPQSAEALVLHHIDNLDAKTKGYFEVVEGRGEVNWTQLQNLFRRPLTEPRAADADDGRGNG